MAVAIESGFPKNTQANTAQLTVTGVTTAGASLIVAVVGGDSGAVAFPGSASGGGLSWSKAVGKAWTGGSFVNEGGCEIWTAVSSGPLTNQSLSWTANGSNNLSGQLTIYSITGASSSLGATGGKEDGTGGSAAVDATLTAQAGGSLVLGAVFDGQDGGSLTARSDTTQDFQYNDGGQGSTVMACHATALTSGPGSVTIGSTTSKQFYAGAALELKASAIPPIALVNVLMAGAGL